MRLFLAIELPAAVRMQLNEITARLKECGAPVGWVKPEHIHCTLKFLGETGPDRLPDIRQALAGLPVFSPFDLQVRRLGVFPGWQNPRVIWAGLEPARPHLLQLQEDIERRLQPAGFPAEDREFRPHLTLGRVKGKNNLQNLTKYITEMAGTFDAGSFQVREVTLFQSILRPEGPEYRALLHSPGRGVS